MESILADQKDREQYASMTSILTKTDRVLTGEPVVVEVVNDGWHMPPSYTDGKTITFNRDKIGSITSTEDLVNLLGLNYHEMAHVLFTPRANTDLVKSVMAAGLHPAFNILEDQRIETFLTSMYPSTIPYFTSTLLRYCAETEVSWKMNHLLVYGRRYLPTDIRREFRRRFVKPELLADAEDIIDQYRKLIFPNDDVVALALIERFDKILRQTGEAPPADPHGHAAGNRPDVKKGRTTQREQRDASRASDEFDSELADRDEEEESGDEIGGSQTDEPSDEERDGEGSGDGSADEQEDGDEGSGGGRDDSDGDSDSTSSQSGGESSGQESEGKGAANSGSSPTTQPSLDDESFREMMKDIVEQVEQLDEVIEDVTSKQRAIVNGDGEIDTNLPGKRSSASRVSDDMVNSARQFAAVIDQLRSESDPGWHRYAPSGKVNLQRYMRGESYDRIWDKWAEGNNDAADIECVITIDTSISMSYQIHQASRAMWIIKKALESIDASVTVIAYNTKTALVYDKKERVSSSEYKALKASDGTAPHQAIVEAVRILEASRRANRIFITITDGEWPYEYSSRDGFLTSEQMIEELGKRGVLTALAYVGYDGYGIDGHRCQIAGGVMQSSQLVEFARKIVAASMKRRYQ